MCSGVCADAFDGWRGPVAFEDGWLRPVQAHHHVEAACGDWQPVRRALCWFVVLEVDRDGAVRVVSKAWGAVTDGVAAVRVGDERAGGAVDGERPEGVGRGRFVRPGGSGGDRRGGRPLPSTRATG